MMADLPAARTTDFSWRIVRDGVLGIAPGLEEEVISILLYKYYTSIIFTIIFTIIISIVYI